MPWDKEAKTLIAQVLQGEKPCLEGQLNVHQRGLVEIIRLTERSLFVDSAPPEVMVARLRDDLAKIRVLAQSTLGPWVTTKGE